MFNQESSPNFSKISDDQLKLSSWYVTNKLLLKKILIGFLIALDVIFWSYVLYGLINHYFIEQPRFNLATQQLTSFNDYTNIRTNSAPENLEAGTASVFTIGNGRYDLAANIRNKNSRWYIEFDYNFVADGESLPVKQGFVLPNEEKYLLNLGTEFDKKPRRVSLEISNLKWHKIDAHEISDYDMWKNARLNLAFEEVKFSPAVIRGNLTISRASFVAKNLTAYNFWDTGLYVLLYKGNKLASVNYVTLEEFISGQSRSVQVSWFEPVGTVTKVEIHPDLNIFDKKVYMPVD